MSYLCPHCNSFPLSARLRWLHTEHRDEPLSGSREGLTDGLKEFIKINSHRALEVGYLSHGMGDLQSTKGPKDKKDIQR